MLTHTPKGLPPTRTGATRTGEPGSTTDTLEQLETELGLEIANLAPQRRLGDPKPRGGLREASRVGHRDEVANVPELHRQLMPGGY